MLKLTGVIAIFTACTVIGLYFSKQLKRRVEIFRQTRLMIDKIATLIKFRSYTVYELCDEILRDGMLSEMSFVSFQRDEDKSFSALWEDSVLKWNVPIKKEERDFYINLGNSLGTTDTEGQISSLSVFYKEAEKMLCTAEKDFNEKGKLCRALGVLCGAFVSILLI